jgi:hypothetical protein
LRPLRVVASVIALLYPSGPVIVTWAGVDEGNPPNVTDSEPVARTYTTAGALALVPAATVTLCVAGDPA